MADELRHKHSRRGILRAALVIGAGAPLLTARPALAQKTSKEAANYQSTPKNGEKCSGCRFFIAPSGGATMGQCQVVTGDISPDGWCSLYVPAS